MTDRPKALQLYSLVPGSFGDTAVVRHLSNGGLVLQPYNPEDPKASDADTASSLVLDPDQTKTLSAMLSMDPGEAARIAAESMREDLLQFGFRVFAGSTLSHALAFGLGILACVLFKG